MDETHRVMAVYICTRCGQTFHRGDELDVIRDHLVKCTIRVPAFLRTCRFCGLVSLFQFHHKRTCTFNFFHHKRFFETVYIFFSITNDFPNMKGAIYVFFKNLNRASLRR